MTVFPPLRVPLSGDVFSCRSEAIYEILSAVMIANSDDEEPCVERRRRQHQLERVQQLSPIQPEGRFGLDKRPVDNLKVQVDGCLLPSLVSRLTIMSKDDSATSA